MVSCTDKTLELALQLHPATKRVFVVAYAPTTRLPDRVQTALRGVSNRVQLTYLDEPSVARLLAAVKAVPGGSLILFIRHSQEDRGDVLFPADVARLVSEASPVPYTGSATRTSDRASSAVWSPRECSLVRASDR